MNHNQETAMDSVHKFRIKQTQESFHTVRGEGTG
jgi:hypothetical protein